MPPAKKSTQKESKEPALPNDWRYEDTLARIEDITEQLESGDLPLAEVFEQFSDAMIALQQCDQFLQSKQAEATLLIETLVSENENL